jgi:hypothetical protein
MRRCLGRYGCFIISVVGAVQHGTKPRSRLHRCWHRCRRIRLRLSSEGSASSGRRRAPPRLPSSQQQSPRNGGTERQAGVSAHPPLHCHLPPACTRPFPGMHRRLFSHCQKTATPPGCTTMKSWPQIADEALHHQKRLSPTPAVLPPRAMRASSITSSLSHGEMSQRPQRQWRLLPQ